MRHWIDPFESLRRAETQPGKIDLRDPKIRSDMVMTKANPDFKFYQDLEQLFYHRALRREMPEFNLLLRDDLGPNFNCIYTASPDLLAVIK